MNTKTRSEILDRFRAKVAAGRPIIGGGAGTGLSAKLAEAGGIDLIIIYNSGRFRMAGRGSLAGLMPYGDANAIVMEMAREVLPVVERTPVLAGVCATDPFRIMSQFLGEVRDAGFAGVQNFPTVGLVDGTFRAGPRGDRDGLRQGGRDDRPGPGDGPADLPLRPQPRRGPLMAEAGADILVPHVGLTTKGLIGAQSAADLATAAARVQAMADAAFAVRPDVIVLCHGGPIAEPDDVAEIFRTTRGIAGFFGASSIERLPTEPAIIAQVRAFTALQPPVARLNRLSGAGRSSSNSSHHSMSRRRARPVGRILGAVAVDGDGDDGPAFGQVVGELEADVAVVGDEDLGLVAHRSDLASAVAGGESAAASSPARPTGPGPGSGSALPGRSRRPG